ncbi:MAG: pectate lyase [Planctomycetota bacterium]
MAILRVAFALALLVQVIYAVSAQEPSKAEVLASMKRAASYYANEVASHGGYVYFYSLDLKQRWGEGVATRDQIWVQPPGTPTVGLALLEAYEATEDKLFLDAGVAAARALIHGQLKSGGWTNCVDFNAKGTRVADYRNGKGRGKNNSSLDDGQTQSAIRLLIHADRLTKFQDREIHDAALLAIKSLLAAQFPNGGFPQVWTGPVQSQPIIDANYPGYDWRTEGRIKNYWDMYTLNDNVCGYVADTLIEAHWIYRSPMLLESIKKLGDFLVLAQMPKPQRGWAQQYNYDMQPIWARKFEPPGVSGDETQEVIETLIKIALVTRESKYMEPIPAALEWLRQSQLPGGQVARYYELKTNRPLFMKRNGKQYSLTYSDADLPKHYGWKTASRVDELTQLYNDVRFEDGGLDLREAERFLRPFIITDIRRLPTGDATRADEVSAVLSGLDEHGRWVSTYNGERLVGQAKMPVGAKYLSSEIFSSNLRVLARTQTFQDEASSTRSGD